MLLGVARQSISDSTLKAEDGFTRIDSKWRRSYANLAVANTTAFQVEGKVRGGTCDEN
jgi:hypothetical protein